MKQSENLSELLSNFKDYWDIQVIKELLEQGVSPCRNTRFFYPLRSPLVLAAKWQSIELVTLLLDYGAPVDEFELGNRLKITALRAACYNCHVEMIQLLIQRGADINLHIKQRISPSRKLLEHINILDIQAVKELLKQGVSPCRNTRFFYPLQSPLVLAAKMKSIELVTLLLDYGAPVDEFILGKRGEITALRIACYHCHTEMIELLIQRGANINLHTKHMGRSNLHLVIQRGDKDLVKMLLDKGASLLPVMRNTHWYKIPFEMMTFLIEESPNLTQEELFLWEEEKKYRSSN